MLGGGSACYEGDSMWIKSSRSTSSERFILEVMVEKMSRFCRLSGMVNSIFRSNLPGRRRAGSSVSDRLVAMITCVWVREGDIYTYTTVNFTCHPHECTFSTCVAFQCRNLYSVEYFYCIAVFVSMFSLGLFGVVCNTWFVWCTTWLAPGNL